MEALELLESIRNRFKQFQTFISLGEKYNHRKYPATVEPGIEGIYDFE